MGRFGCFYGHVPNHEQQKSAQPSFKTMMKMLQLGSQDHSFENSFNPIASQEYSVVKDKAIYFDIGIEDHTITTCSWKSGEQKCECDADSNSDSRYIENRHFRRSFSTGCELDQKTTFGDNNTHNSIDQGVSCEGSDGCNETSKVLVPKVAESVGITFQDQDQEVPGCWSPHLCSYAVNHGFSSPLCNRNILEKEGHDDTHVPLYTKCVDNCGAWVSKSCSMPDFGSTSPTSARLYSKLLVPHNRSFKNLNMLGIKRDFVLAHDHNIVANTGQCEDDIFYHWEKFDGENTVVDNYESYDYGCSSKDWIVPVPEEISIIKKSQVDSLSKHRGDFPNKDFKMKRIEDWVTDLQHCCPKEVTNNVADFDNNGLNGHWAFLGCGDKVPVKISPGMEAAKRYIASLNATATSAHRFVRITVGALPRGLHMLNLSKNKLSTIEGLKELTKLRILDLSYNKISRIGHGLAYCCSLKELYLAGNKISEVEGLHRLLKLYVLDLRFNKIANSKCLGQLAANYNSLQAISLEGNPAQKNVGEDQLKKFIQGLLPYLAYYNHHNIKSSTLKDSSDRSARLGVTIHQFDRGCRSDYKCPSRQGNYSGVVAKRSSHSSMHGLKGQESASMKQSRRRHGFVPPSDSRPSHHQSHFDIGKRLVDLRYGLSVHKSWSMGNLAVV